VKLEPIAFCKRRLQKPRLDLSDFGHVQDVHRVELIMTSVLSIPLRAAHPEGKEKEKKKVKMFVIVVTADILLVTIALFQLRNNIHFFVLSRACLWVCDCYQAELFTVFKLPFLCS